MSQGEIEGALDGFIGAAFESGTALSVAESTLGRRARIFESYLADILARDVKQVARIQRSGDMRRLLSLLAAQSAGLVNHSRLASEPQISASTVRDYLEILETVYPVEQIPAWSADSTTRAVATPKILFADSGLILAIEVKASETARSDDFAGLRSLQRRLGRPFRTGFLLYCGTQYLHFGEGLACAPMSALWTSGTPRAHT